MGPYEYTVVELQYTVGNSDKFYRGYLDRQNGDVFFQYGKNTWSALNYGNWTDKKKHNSVSDGHDAMMKQIRSKIAKGYEIVRTTSILCARQADHFALAKVLTQEVALDKTSLVLANV